MYELTWLQLWTSMSWLDYSFERVRVDLITALNGYELTWLQLWTGTSWLDYSFEQIWVDLITALNKYELTWLQLWTGTSWLDYELSKDELGELRVDAHPLRVQLHIRLQLQCYKQRVLGDERSDWPPGRIMANCPRVAQCISTVVLSVCSLFFVIWQLGKYPEGEYQMLFTRDF